MRLRERARSEVGGREFALGNVAIVKWLEGDLSEQMHESRLSVKHQLMDP